MMDEKQINLDIKESMYQDIITSIRLARQGEMTLSLQEIGTAIREAVKDDEELKIIKEKL